MRESRTSNDRSNVESETARIREMVRDYANPTVADLLVFGLVLLVIGLGGYNALQAYLQRRAMSGMMMAMPGTNPLWHLLVTVVAVSLIVGVYGIARQHVFDTSSSTGDASVTTGTTRNDSDGGEDHSEPGRVPSILPDDERRILEPVLESPGLTQVELRGRSDFSKAKVSQTVSELEDRGLIYRERQGRTYRIYPGKLLEDPE